MSTQTYPLQEENGTLGISKLNLKMFCQKLIHLWPPEGEILIFAINLWCLIPKVGHICIKIPHQCQPVACPPSSKTVPQIILVYSWWNKSRRVKKTIIIASFFGQYTFHSLPLLLSLGNTVFSFRSQQAWLSVGQPFVSTTADLSSQRVHAEQLVGFCFKLVCTELLCTAVHPHQVYLPNTAQYNLFL